MMLLKNCYLLFFLLLSTQVFSQTATNKAKQKVQETNRSVKESKETVNEATQTVESAKQTAEAIGGLLNSLGVKEKTSNTANTKKSDGVLISISGFDFGDESIEKLSAELEKQKGVKEVVALFKEGVTTLDVSTKGAIAWNKLSAEVRKPFKVIEITEDKVVLKKAE